MVDVDSRRLLRRGVRLERITLGWNVVGIVVLWELAESSEARQRRALRLIGFAFVALALYIAVQSTVVLATQSRPRHSFLGIVGYGVREAWNALHDTAEPSSN